MPNLPISGLPAGTTIAGTEPFPSVQSPGGTSTTVKLLASDIKTYTSNAPTFTGQSLFPDGTAALPSISHTGDTNTGFWFPAADTIAASTAGSERLRINSSGQLLIGAPNTATAGYGIQVFGGGISISNLAGPSFATPMGAVGAFNLDGVTGGLTFSTSSAGVMGERMRITNAGNVGIGSTNPTQALFIERAGALALQLTNTANSLNLLLGTNTTEAYVSAPNGALAFLAAGSERMRITSAGRVGIGITAPQSNLTVYGGNVTDGAAAFTMNVLNPAIAASGVGSGIMFGANVSTVAVGLDNIAGLAGIEGLKENGTSGDYASALKFTTRINGGSLTERMRITSAGNVGIGTTSPTAKLDITVATGYAIKFAQASTFAYIAANNETGSANVDLNIYSNNQLFSPGGTERMRITSAGNVGIGTTAISGRLTVDTALTGTPGLLVNSSVAAGYASTLLYGTTTTAAGTAFDMIGVYANTVAQFRVRGDGTIYAQNTTVQAISDVRLKDNIRSALDGLSTIMSLRPVRFDWKEGYGNGRKNQLGFVAQEVETVFPDAVDEMKISNASDEAFKTVGPSAFIPVLVKAIQELAAELNELKGKVNA